MRRIFLIIPLIFTLLGCSTDDELRRNPYLPDLNFNYQVDLSLPQYNSLKFPGNSFVTRNYGINGIVIYNQNNDQYMAFELTDPNHIIQDCSYLVVNATEASCSCNDGNVYTIITGQQIKGEGAYSLKPYRVVKVGNVLEVSNR